MCLEHTEVLWSSVITSFWSFVLAPRGSEQKLKVPSISSMPLYRESSAWWGKTELASKSCTFLVWKESSTHIGLPWVLCELLTEIFLPLIRPSVMNKISLYASMTRAQEATSVTLRPLAIRGSHRGQPRCWWQVDPRSPAHKLRRASRGKMFTSTARLSQFQNTKPLSGLFTTRL